jgi:hypothetical protein
MSKLIDSIVNKNFIEADSIVSEAVESIMAKKLEEAKKMCAAKMTEQQGHSMNRTASHLVRLGVVEEDNVEEAIDPTEKYDGPAPTGQRVSQAGKGDKETNTTVVPKNNLKEEEQLDEARVKIIKARIRGGKIQRRKKVSNVPGMTIRGGKLQRMSAAERRRRKMGARKAVRKRAPKMNRALMKRQRSLRKRRALGL